MDKLQWFKFTPSDWFMGKIQRCSEITQARFLRLCCLYWNKECNLSIEDATIEIDKEHLDILISKKIISVNNAHLNISFLDEQFLEIQDNTTNKSTSGIIGNLKRWHPSIYADFSSKKINLETAIKLSKTIANQSHTDSTPIADQSQANRETSQTREDKIRKDESIEEKENNILLEKEPKDFTFKNALIDLGIENKLAEEFIKVRKAKKCVNTETAFLALKKEIELSARDPSEIIKICVERSWGGFKSEWLNKPQTKVSLTSQYDNEI